MSNTTSPQKGQFRSLWLPMIGSTRRAHTQLNALQVELSAALAREAALLREKNDLLQRQDMLMLEFDHRLFNSLQLVTSLLSMQSRQASPEAAAQLHAAGQRVAAFGRVHRRLHPLHHREKVEFKQYLQHLCADLSSLLHDQTDCGIRVEGEKLEIPTLNATPLGFIVAELVTNSAKYAKSDVVVRLETSPTLGHSISVSDSGPGLPPGFDPTKSKGLGMKIVVSLVQQIAGALRITSGPDGRGASFVVTFGVPRFVIVES
jgi:two-component system, sensor histidine kinase PdtaS